jgi:hypothetical protein
LRFQTTYHRTRKNNIPDRTEPDNQYSIPMFFHGTLFIVPTLMFAAETGKTHLPT